MLMIEYGHLNQLIYSYPLVALVVGLVIWVFGWKVYKAFIVVVGALVGALVAYQYTWALDGIFRLIIAIAGGLVGAVLALFALYVMVFLFGVYVGAGVATIYLGAEQWIINLGIGVIVGIVFILLFKFMVVLSTSLTGSYMAVYSIVLLLRFDLSRLWLQIAIVAATVVGVIVQYSVWGSPKDEQLRPSHRR
jgi:hypothetical protein